jgi:hypothetical protein
MTGERLTGGPPTYVLVSESALSSTNYSADFATLVHPVIHYRYADDPPICPPASKTNLLVMDFDPTSSNPPTVSSLTPTLAIDNVTVSDAPGVGSFGSVTIAPTNNNLYVIRTLALANEKYFFCFVQGALLKSSKISFRRTG